MFLPLFVLGFKQYQVDIPITVIKKGTGAQLTENATTINAAIDELNAAGTKLKYFTIKYVHASHLQELYDAGVEKANCVVFPADNLQNQPADIVRVDNTTELATQIKALDADTTAVIVQTEDASKEYINNYWTFGVFNSLLGIILLVALSCCSITCFAQISTQTKFLKKD